MYWKENDSTGIRTYNIDEGDGIVKLDADSALKIIALDNLAKYVPKQQ